MARPQSQFGALACASGLWSFDFVSLGCGSCYSDLQNLISRVYSKEGSLRTFPRLRWAKFDVQLDADRHP